MLPKNAAVIADVTRRTLTNWCAKNPKLGTKLGGRLHINEREFVEMITGGTGLLTYEQALRYAITQFGECHEGMISYAYRIDDLQKKLDPDFSHYSDNPSMPWQELKHLVFIIQRKLIDQASESEKKIRWKQMFGTIYKDYEWEIPA